MKKILLLGLLLLCPQLAQAQTSRNPCYTTGQTGLPNCIGVGVASPLPVILGGGSGGAAGSTSNASSGVATSSTNIPAVAYNYVWNGATWDQASGLTTGTVGVPSAQVITVQPPASNGTYPTAAIPITGNATGTTAAVVGTLAGTSGKTTYVCGLHVDAIGGTATIGPVTLAGIVGNPMVFYGSSSATGNQGVPSSNFWPCIPASAANTAITLTTTANGTATGVSVNMWGFQQ